MKVTVLGCSGSLAAPGNPASGYLVEPTEGAPVVMDLGPGCLPALQQLLNPSEVHVAFSHLHPDHCLEFPSLMVWRRYHPQRAATRRHRCLGPTDTFGLLGRLSSDTPGQVDDMSDTFDFSPWTPHEPQDVGGVRITPFPVIHPVEAYALRAEDQATGAVVAYSGDTAYTEELVRCAKNADLFFCEATWGACGDGKAPKMHVSGAEAGRAARLAGAKTLILVHIPPWCDPRDAFEAASREFDGPVLLAGAGKTYAAGE